MSTKSPLEWTPADLKRIVDAMTVLQGYGLDTSSTTMSLCHTLPPQLELPEADSVPDAIGPDDPSAPVIKYSERESLGVGITNERP